MTLNLATLTEPNSPVAEAYRRLRVNLVSAGKEQPLRTVLVAAASASKDKPQVVANLGVAFAKVGQRVILVDCDLRHPGQHTLFGVSGAAGVTTAVKDEKAPLPLQVTEVPGSAASACGPAHRRPVRSARIACDGAAGRSAWPAKPTLCFSMRRRLPWQRMRRSWRPRSTACC